MLRNVTCDEIVQCFDDKQLDDEEKAYLDYHCLRLKAVTNLIIDLITGFQNNGINKVKVLDIGPHFLTAVIKCVCDSHILLDTLGYKYEHIVPLDQINQHIQYDLNQSQNEKLWVKSTEKYDIIVFAEVIEHLYVAPQLVLKHLRTLLSHKGKIVIQTPNAVAIRKRLNMFKGINPFEMIRESYENPGHFREYTLNELNELNELCQLAGLKISYTKYEDYWPESGFLRLLEKRTPSFRNGITIVCEGI